MKSLNDRSGWLYCFKNSLPNSQLGMVRATRRLYYSLALEFFMIEDQ